MAGSSGGESAANPGCNVPGYRPFARLYPFQTFEEMVETSRDLVLAFAHHG